MARLRIWSLDNSSESRSTDDLDQLAQMKQQGGDAAAGAPGGAGIANAFGGGNARLINAFSPAHAQVGGGVDRNVCVCVCVLPRVRIFSY